MKLKKFISEYPHALFIIACFLIAELITFPVGEFPLNDDWTYAKSVLNLLEHGTYDIGISTSSLWTHLMWGQLVCKIFGFSFMALRLSTLAVSLAGILLLYRLVSRITANRNAGVIAALVMLFNPMYYNLSNTFMTDVNFIALVTAAAYLIYKFHESPRPVYIAGIAVLSILLILLRQFGIVVPVSFFLSCFFIRQRKLYFITLSFLVAALVFGVLKFYEHYLHQVQQTVHYKASEYDLTDPALQYKIKLFITLRYRTILLHIMVYTFPFTVIFLPGLIKSAKWWFTIPALIISCWLSVYFFTDLPGLMGNIFTNMAVGAETFYQFLRQEVRAPFDHTYSPAFEKVLLWTWRMFASGSFLILLLLAYKGIAGRKFTVNPFTLFILFMTGTYIILLFIFDLYFDRYHLPLILSSLILFTMLARNVKPFAAPGVIIVVIMFYISAFGTRDYFVLNRHRWEAYHFLREKLNVPAEKINGGNEVNCWHEGQSYSWWDHIFLENHDYLIQYRQEPKFMKLREYPFQRFFPVKKDTVRIFIRVSK